MKKLCGKASCFSFKCPHVHAAWEESTEPSTCSAPHNGKHTPRTTWTASLPTLSFSHLFSMFYLMFKCPSAGHVYSVNCHGGKHSPLFHYLSPPSVAPTFCSPPSLWPRLHPPAFFFFKHKEDYFTILFLGTALCTLHA